MNTFLKISIIFIFPSLMGLSCGYKDEIVITKTVGMDISKILKKWGELNNLESFDCNEYWTKDDLPTICIRTLNSEDKVPQFVVSVSKLQQKTFVIITIMEYQTDSKDRKILLSTLSKVFVNKFGKEYVEIKN